MGCRSLEAPIKQVSEQPLPDFNAQQYQYLLFLEQLVKVTHQMNINHDYQHIIKPILNSTTGKGWKETCKYQSIVTKDELQNQQILFWESRNSGFPQKWLAIRRALNCHNEKMAKQLLKKQNLIVISDNIQMMADYYMNRYQIPLFCINKPNKYGTLNKTIKNNHKSFKPENIMVKIRNPKYSDHVMEISTGEIVEVLKKKYLKMLERSEDSKVRMMFNGRQLHSDHMIGQYKIKDGSCIQALTL